MTDIFDSFAIVDEKTIVDFIHEYRVLCDNHQGCSTCQNKRGSVNTRFKEITQFATLQFKTFDYGRKLEVEDIGNSSQAASDVPLAQIIIWEWNQAKATQEIKETKMLNYGATISIVWHISFAFSVRILKKREQISENPCPSSSCPGDDYTVRIRNDQITVSAAWLMAISPVINRMLNTEMIEQQQRSVTLNDLGVNMEQFKEFLKVISVTSFQSPFLANPKNVLCLLKLADYFQVDEMKARCETHLINCVEIPLIDRFLLIEPYRLDTLKMFFMKMEIGHLRAFFKANLAQITQKMRAELSIGLCRRGI